ncbi:hypothetical protein LPW26_04360 [Rhodopseudomonas sp. HC1]|uniref:hypothetical protein n=1 Tax=Rhodopseudomonas infernalis TaxID=2897386 RepID=UPI001EE84402|nr:hypothetical protein [Rhodopseudomonas infernalis]MCG6203861.1 hypothetical protein [Rhodopseudomonas infernalis]
MKTDFIALTPSPRPTMQPLVCFATSDASSAAFVRLPTKASTMAAGEKTIDDQSQQTNVDEFAALRSMRCNVKFDRPN